MSIYGNSQLLTRDFRMEEALQTTTKQQQTPIQFPFFQSWYSSIAPLASDSRSWRLRSTEQSTVSESWKHLTDSELCESLKLFGEAYDSPVFHSGEICVTRQPPAFSFFRSGSLPIALMPCIISSLLLVTSYSSLVRPLVEATPSKLSWLLHIPST